MPTIKKTTIPGGKTVGDVLGLPCDGHPAGEFDPMGRTVYCDGSCKSSKVDVSDAHVWNGQKWLRPRFVSRDEWQKMSGEDKDQALQQAEAVRRYCELSEQKHGIEEEMAELEPLVRGKV